MMVPTGKGHTEPEQKEDRQLKCFLKKNLSAFSQEYIAFNFCFNFINLQPCQLLLKRQQRLECQCF